MLFTRIGRGIAWLALVLGVIRIVMGFGVATYTSGMEQNAAAAREYLGAANTGEAINKGMYYVLAAIVLGILCEISTHLAAAKER